MHDVTRVQDLIRELEQLPMNALVTTAVVKYPGKFEVRDDWASSDAVEVVPLEAGEVYLKDGLVMICVELTEYHDELENYLPGQTSS